jgi:hypothetical protein
VPCAPANAGLKLPLKMWDEIWKIMVKEENMY